MKGQMALNLFYPRSPYYKPQLFDVKILACIQSCVTNFMLNIVFLDDKMRLYLNTAFSNYKLIQALEMKPIVPIDLQFKDAIC